VEAEALAIALLLGWIYAVRRMVDHSPTDHDPAQPQPAFSNPTTAKKYLQEEIF
jgi:hypothetical protein